jgi:hypothetical protein
LLLGNVRLRKSLDYEQTKDYIFTIAARDGGKETTTTVEIFVTDVNDNAPVFKNDPYSADVAENAKIGHLVRTVIATDADSGYFGRVTYSITNGNSGKAFRIDAAGIICHIISTDDDPGLRIESFAVINLRGVSTNKTIIKLI